MALELERRVICLVQDVLGADLSMTPDWLVRPGRLECGSQWARISHIYSELTGEVLPDLMRPIERRKVDAVMVRRDHAPFILEVDEKQHFNEYRALTLQHYEGVPLSFDIAAWWAASHAKRKLEGGGFAKPMAPLFPGLNGRHRQRAFRDALCDLLPPAHGFAPTLRIAYFEVSEWIVQPGAAERFRDFLKAKIGE